MVVNTECCIFVPYKNEIIMKTTVKNIDKGTYGMTANMKKLLVDVVNMNDEKYFNVKLKVNNTSMTITPTGNKT